MDLRIDEENGWPVLKDGDEVVVRSPQRAELERVMAEAERTGVAPWAPALAAAEPAATPEQ